MTIKHTDRRRNILLRFIYQGYRHLGAAVLIGLVTYLIKTVFPTLEAQIVALLFLLPVMVSTVFWGLTPGILASFLGFLAFNYFFIQPYNTLLVHQTRDLISLIVFLIVAGVMSQLIGQAREGLRLARQREWEATRMYELISALSSANDCGEVLQILARFTFQTFECNFVEVHITNYENDELFQSSFPQDRSISSDPDLHIPLDPTGFKDGEIKVWRGQIPFTDGKVNLLKTFGSQGSHAIEKIYYKNRETRVKVLEESNQVKTSLLNSVSHELRTPLAAIKASVSSLRTGAVNWNSPERTELLSTIEEEADHLNLLVGNLLDMSRIESGALNPNLQLNSISEIAIASAAKIRNQLSNHKLVFDFPEDLPFVKTDFVMMGQVFINLINNSVKYAPLGTEITIGACHEHDKLVIRVCNKSPNLPEEQLEKIFEKFHRITDADKTTGTGLGLSICKGIIEVHGGRIKAENLSDGFMFSFSLPLSKKVKPGD